MNFTVLPFIKKAIQEWDCVAEYTSQVYETSIDQVFELVP